ncbi:hypothetical protein G6F31_017205 [Rhizopus arrhizus]|nr:hypothetical protein G6F31_017205 [Rhizopus arrhizus]
MAGCWRSSTGVRSSWPRWPADGSARWPAAGLHLRSFRQFRSVVGRHAAAGLVAADRGHAAGGAAGAGLGRRQPPPAGGVAGAGGAAAAGPVRCNRGPAAGG